MRLNDMGTCVCASGGVGRMLQARPLCTRMRAAGACMEKRKYMNKVIVSVVSDIRSGHETIGISQVTVLLTELWAHIYSRLVSKSS